MHCGASVAQLLAEFQSEMCLISQGSYLHSFNTAFVIFCKGVTFALKSRWGSVWQFFTEAGVGITIRSQTLSVPMSILGECAQWHSKFSSILVVCADRWTRIGFKSVTNYTVRPAFSVQFFNKKKKSTELFYTFSIMQPHRAQVCTNIQQEEKRSIFPPQEAYHKGQSLLMQRLSCATTVSKSDMKRLL